jgi:flagellar biosynthesis/type III secretory pathway protein FliH
VNKFNDITQSSLDEWIYYLKNSTLPNNYSAKGLEEAQEILNVLQMNDQERIDYDAYQKSLAISYNVIETAKIEGIAMGKEEGITMGKEEGIAIGKEEGIAMGKEEGIVIGKEEGIVEGIAMGKKEGIAMGKEEEKEIVICNAYKKLNDIQIVAEIVSATSDKVTEILKKNGLI